MLFAPSSAEESLKEWHHDLEAEWQLALHKRSLLEESLLKRVQKTVHRLYLTNAFQFFVVFLIVCNFVVNIVEAEVLFRKDKRLNLTDS